MTTNQSSAIMDEIFTAEHILKKRIRKVGAKLGAVIIRIDGCHDF